MTTYTVVSELDDPTWPCIECLRVHIMPISAKWKRKSLIHIGFIVFNGGVATFFAKSVQATKKINEMNNMNLNSHSKHYTNFCPTIFQ